MTSPRAPLELLLVTHSLSGGGAERFAVTLANHLDRARFRPTLCAVTARRSYAVASDVPVVDLGYRGPFDLPQTVRRLRGVIASQRPDLVLSNVLSTNCLTGAALCGGRPRPAWVARVGNAPGPREPFLQRRWARRVYPLARTVVANAAEMAAAVAAAYPAVRDRLASLPNPTDFEAIDQRAAAESVPRAALGERVLLWVGRLTPQKRPDLLLEAFADIRRHLPARLWIAGDGPLRGAIERDIARRGLGGAIELLGFCENPFPLMAAADLFLLTSDFEGLPNALIEAQGLGLPAVAARCPFGPAEIIEEGVTGHLVPPGDAPALARAALALLAQPERLEALREPSRRRARQRYGLEAVLPQWERLLAQAAEGG